MNAEFAKHLIELGEKTSKNFKDEELKEFIECIVNLFDGYPNDSLFYSGFIHGMSGTEGILKALVSKKKIKKEGADWFEDVAVMIISKAAKLYLEAVDKEDKKNFLMD